MELREKLARLIHEEIDEFEAPMSFRSAEKLADAILDIPEIKEALVAKRVLDKQPDDAEFSDIRFEIFEALGGRV